MVESWMGIKRSFFVFFFIILLMIPSRDSYSCSVFNEPESEGGDEGFVSPTFSRTAIKKPPELFRWGRKRMHRSKWKCFDWSSDGGKQDCAIYDLSRGTSSQLVYWTWSSVMIFHERRPDLLCNFGYKCDISFSWTVFPVKDKTVEITASSSIGLREQVLYTTQPPTFTHSNPLMRILTWRGCKRKEYFKFHDAHNSGFFLYQLMKRRRLTRVPSPLQGTSHRTLSKEDERGVGGKSCARQWVTAILVEWQQLRWLISIPIRFIFASFATIQPFPCWIISRRWSVFEPGDAHISRMQSSFEGARNKGGSILTNSSRSIIPLLLSSIKYACRSENWGTFFSFFRWISN